MIAPFGHTFENNAIQEWLQYKKINPLTLEDFYANQLIRIEH